MTLFQHACALRCASLLLHLVWLHGAAAAQLGLSIALPATVLWLYVVGNAVAGILRKEVRQEVLLALVCADVLLAAWSTAWVRAWNADPYFVPLVVAALLLRPAYAVATAGAAGAAYCALSYLLGGEGWLQPALLRRVGTLALVPLAAALLSRSILRRKADILRLTASSNRSIQIGEFLNHVLFQVREYLTSITSVTEHLALTLSDPALKELAGKLKFIVAECNGKIGRMLETVVRSGASRDPAKPRAYSMRQLLEDSLEAARMSAPPSDARVRFDCDPRIGTLRGDPEVMFCVLTGLIQNAFEALAARRPRGTLAVKARLGGENSPGVEVEIRDDAGGFEPGTLERAFTPMFTTKAESGGLGLGLSMALRMVDRCGGALTLRNEDGGAVARVQVPLVPTLPTIRDDDATWARRRRMIP